MEYDCPQPQSLENKEHQHKSSQAHVPTFCFTILYYTILYYTILYYTILYYTILYYTILYYTILYYTILYYTILYYTILYYYYTIPYHIPTLESTVRRLDLGTAEQKPRGIVSSMRPWPIVLPPWPRGSQADLAG